VFVRGAALWRVSPEWPLPGAEAAALHLRGAGRANARSGDGSLSREAPPDGAEPADTFVCDPRDPVLADDDAAECREDVLCYTTPGLPEACTLAGPVRLLLFAASSAALTDFCATLSVLGEGEARQPLCEGVLRSRGQPGVERRLELDLGAACARLEAGQKLRLAISSSAFPRWDRPSHTEVEPGLAADEQVAPAQQTVFHDRERPSHLLLWLLPG
jgi:putative CocE/NonD family hydrolase